MVFIMNIEERLQKFRIEFDSVLVSFLNSLKPQSETIGQVGQQVYEIVRDFTLQGGKRLRPFLVYTAYHGYEGHDTQEILKASCAIELMQSHLLIHDDIFDRSYLRRGYPTVHKIIERLFSSTKVADLSHFGISMAILAGNLAAQYGALALSQSGFSFDRKVKALDLYINILTDESYGQILDMQAETGQEMNEKDIMALSYYKTTRYSIEGPLHLGTILADAPDSELRTLSLFAKPLGNIFQLQDDILGLFGSEEIVGKSIVSDMKEGKLTLLILKALECACEEDKNFIRKSLGKQDITQEEVQHIRDIMLSCGSLKHAQDLIKSWVVESGKALQNCSLLPEAREVLSEFSQYLARRTY
jgi:geranylgeranyl diphosphate synthase type I